MQKTELSKNLNLEMELEYDGEERMVYISDFNSIPKLNWKNRKGDEKIIWDSIINL